MTSPSFLAQHMRTIIWALVNNAKNECLFTDNHHLVQQWLDPLDSLLDQVPEYAPWVLEAIHANDSVFQNHSGDENDACKNKWEHDTARFR